MLGTGLATAWHGLRRGIRAARYVLGFLLLVGFLAGALASLTSIGMIDVTKSRILTPAEAQTAAAEQPFDCILILGAGLREDGSPSDMLHDRVMTGVEVFLSNPHAFGAILMSGDHTGDYNEVAAMKALAVKAGVSSSRIFLDHEGYSTYESISRVKDVFGARRLLIVTQAYHLHRALYIADALGLDARGVSADLRPYRGQTKRELREVLARYKDFFQAGRGEPSSPDALPVDLNGNGDLT